jgi:signal transduction histidine kinase
MIRKDMTSHRKAQLAFGSAVLLLSLSGLAVYFTISRLLQSEQWLVHTYDVRIALAEVDAAVVRAGRACNGYLTTGNDDFERDFELAVPQVSEDIRHLRELTSDNPRQQYLCSRFEVVASNRLALFRESIHLRKTAPQDDAGQTDIRRRGIALSADLTSTMQQMRDEEQQLLNIRTQASRRWFDSVVVLLTAAFIFALLLFSVHYRLLAAELEARQQAEHAARVSEESLRRLTGRLLQLQDEERRKFSRELHDSLGQYLAGVKMNLDMFSSARPDDRLLSEAISLLDQSIAETRTISHLLHPPLLDEAGFSSAATWYLDGFAQRSGIQIRLDFPPEIGRLPRPVELGLFRVLQESLTNIHRHAGSSKAEISMRLSADQVVLAVRDHGKGIPRELLESFRRNGTNAGIGLAGMRERMRELGGQLEVESSASGTMISVTIPLERSAQPSSVSAAD